jgi:hypothetical protein
MLPQPRRPLNRMGRRRQAIAARSDKRLVCDEDRLLEGTQVLAGYVIVGFDNGSTIDLRVAGSVIGTESTLAAVGMQLVTLGQKLRGFQPVYLWDRPRPATDFGTVARQTAIANMILNQDLDPKVRNELEIYVQECWV